MSRLLVHLHRALVLAPAGVLAVYVERNGRYWAGGSPWSHARWGLGGPHPRLLALGLALLSAGVVFGVSFAASVVRRQQRCASSTTAALGVALVCALLAAGEKAGFRWGHPDSIWRAWQPSVGWWLGLAALLVLAVAPWWRQGRL